MKMKKYIIIGMIYCLLFGSMGSFSLAAAQYPEKVRIGLFYADTSVSTFNISAAKGLQAGNVLSGKFNLLYEEPGANVLTIVKDTSYHIRVGSNYADRNAAMQQVQVLKQKGIAAYTSYADKWEVWTGFYQSLTEAQSDINNNLKKKLGSGTYQVVDPSAQRVGVRTASGETIFTYESASGIFQIRPKAENNPYGFKLNSTGYRGDLEVRRMTGSDMTVINVLPVEQYLYGVVPSEMESNSPLEALKAQAVAARTYTYNNIGRYEKYNFDLDNTIKSQVYKGLSGESAAGNKAVDETKEKKVTYNGNPARVFYFAASGGRTEDVKNVWGSDIPYLKSVDDKYETKNRPWEVTLTPAKIKEALAAKGFNIGDITNMAITKTAPDSSRVTELTVTGTLGKKVFTLESCRTIFGLNSQMYTISTDLSGSAAALSILGKDSKGVFPQTGQRKIITSEGLKTINTGIINIIGAAGIKQISPVQASGTPTLYRLSGKGWGHGIGMSQEGAKGMATAGFKYDQILTYYFMGTKVE